MALGKGGILKHAGSFKAHEVHVPAWADETGDDTVLVRGMTIREFEINGARAGEGEATASVIARCVIDENGDRVFEDSDVPQLAELPVADVQAVSEAIVKASGLGDSESGKSDVDVAIEKAGKGSEPTPPDGSSSD